MYLKVTVASGEVKHRKSIRLDKIGVSVCNIEVAVDYMNMNAKNTVVIVMVILSDVIRNSLGYFYSENIDLLQCPSTVYTKYKQLIG